MIKQAITLVKKGLQSYRFLRSSVQKVEVSISSLLSLFNFQLVLKCQISEIKAKRFLDVFKLHECIRLTHCIDMLVSHIANTNYFISVAGFVRLNFLQQY